MIHYAIYNNNVKSLKMVSIQHVCNYSTRGTSMVIENFYRIDLEPHSVDRVDVERLMLSFHYSSTRTV